MSDLDAQAFNAREIDEGRVDARIVTLLTRDYQVGRGLEVHGKCNLETRRSLLERVTEGPESPLGLMTLAVALEEMAKGAGEVGSNNRGPWVRKYTRGVGEGQSWCAWLQSWCMEQSCLRLGVEMPIAPGFRYRNWRGARRFCREVIKAGGVRIDRPEVGCLVLWDRGVIGSWQAHLGICSWQQERGTLFRSVEGNVGRFPSKLREYAHEEGERRLLWFVRMPVMENLR